MAKVNWDELDKKHWSKWTPEEENAQRLRLYIKIGNSKSPYEKMQEEKAAIEARQEAAEAAEMKSPEESLEVARMYNSVAILSRRAHDLGISVPTSGGPLEMQISELRKALSSSEKTRER